MADYWKSTAKKYCKLCDVWYADNRISIENHERGLKHKGMLEKHLRDMSKREKQREAAQGHMNATLIAMEAAALAAMEGDGIPVTTPAKTQKVVSRPVLPKVDPKQEIKDRKRKIKELKQSAKQSEFWSQNAEDDCSIYEWVQAEANGQTYYWNIFTQETAWDAPGMFYTTEEYDKDYSTITQKVNEILIKRSKYVPPPPEEKQPKITKTQIKEHKKLPRPESVHFAKPVTEIDIEFKKQISKNRAWDIRSLIESDVVEVPESSESIPTTSKYVERVEPPKSSGLGPWIPIEKKPPSMTELQKKDETKVLFDDLPQQESAQKDDSFYEEYEHDAEIKFEEKVLPVTTSKKSKPVFFRKTKSKTPNIKQE